MRKIQWSKASESPPLVRGMLPEARTALWTDEHSLRQDISCRELSANRFVIVIDDSATVRIIIETCLRQAGLTVRSFHDGIDAIQWLSQPDVCMPALIFLDIELPRMDGYDVALQLKAQPQLKASVIVMLSRRNGVIDRLKCRLAGASAYLAKPFTVIDILHMVETLLGFPTHSVRGNNEAEEKMPIMPPQPSTGRNS